MHIFCDHEYANIQGTIEYDADIASLTWFRVGGRADILFRPADADDLSCFLKQTPADIPVFIMGLGSNIIIRDGGFRGIVIKLGRGFNQTELIDNYYVRIGAAVPDMNAAKFLADNHLDGGAFLRGIPGNIGGAVRMNAGAYNREIKDIFVSANAVTRSGEKITLNYDDMGFSYRHTTPTDLFYTDVIFKLYHGNKDDILKQMTDITDKRTNTQPIKSKTGGSTFKNPDGYKAWELIDAAGCRGLKIGDAQMSELHCNFMLNLGNATAFDLETLGETVRKRVFENSGIMLEWEIKRIGEPAA